jgi:hypothetical protein
MHRITGVTVLEGFRLELSFEDGVRATVDLSDLAGKGIFAMWLDRTAFERVRIGLSGELIWSDKIDLCPDSLYLRATGMKPEDIFPPLRHEPTHAWDKPLLRHCD